MLRADGCLEYRGRKDSQVKVRGYRIEISEIETALNELESIREAAVVSRETGTSEKQLIAYFVPAVKSAPAISEVREALLRRLPDYMIPAIFVQMQSLPLTPTGKVDRNALASAALPRTNEAATPSAPRDEIEYKLLSLWAQVLDVEAVRLADNFFELGGHSLSSMRLLVEIEREFGQRLPQSILLQFPTVEALARVIRDKREVKEDAFASVLPINRNGSRMPIFCMPGIMGNVFSDLGSLSRAMGADQPFYGLQDGMGVPAGVEAKAGRFLREIRSVQPHGPYLLCGVCSGALTVSAIARRLQEQGEQVTLLAFIEPAFPWQPGPRSWQDFANNVYIRLTKRMDLHTVRVLRLSVLDQARYLLLKLKLLSNMWGSRQYRPGLFKGTIHIFATRPSLAKVPHKFQLAWDGFAANGIRPHEVPGTHNAITGDYDTPIEETVMQMIGQGLREVIDGSASPASNPDASIQTPPWNAATTAAHND
jgi:thioesterase domain-containing protein/acyl carrier protein